MEAMINPRLRRGGGRAAAVPGRRNWDGAGGQFPLIFWPEYKQNLLLQKTFYISCPPGPLPFSIFLRPCTWLYCCSTDEAITWIIYGLTTMPLAWGSRARNLFLWALIFAAYFTLPLPIPHKWAGPRDGSGRVQCSLDNWELYYSTKFQKCLPASWTNGAKLNSFSKETFTSDGQANKQSRKLASFKYHESSF